jgi:hypothetical protein
VFESFGRCRLWPLKRWTERSGDGGVAVSLGGSARGKLGDIQISVFHPTVTGPCLALVGALTLGAPACGVKFYFSSGLLHHHFRSILSSNLVLCHRALMFWPASLPDQGAHNISQFCSVDRPRFHAPITSGNSVPSERRFSHSAAQGELQVPCGCRAIRSSRP